MELVFQVILQIAVGTGILLVIAWPAWYVLQRWVLPRFGIST